MRKTRSATKKDTGWPNKKMNNNLTKPWIFLLSANQWAQFMCPRNATNQRSKRFCRYRVHIFLAIYFNNLVIVSFLKIFKIKVAAIIDINSDPDLKQIYEIAFGRFFSVWANQSIPIIRLQNPTNHVYGKYFSISGSKLKKNNKMGRNAGKK